MSVAPAAEKQRVRVFLAQRQQDEILGAGADGEVGLVCRMACYQALRSEGEVKGNAGVFEDRAATRHDGGASVLYFNELTASLRSLKYAIPQGRNPCPGRIAQLVRARP